MYTYTLDKGYAGWFPWRQMQAALLGVNFLFIIMKEYPSFFNVITFDIMRSINLFSYLKNLICG